MKNLVKTYRIETERLVLRCYQPSDTPVLKKSLDDSLPELLPWTLFREQYNLLVVKLMSLKAFDILGKEIKTEG
jgi:hypothetical protein